MGRLDVAATKAKGNDAAGHVNAFVFPDLCSGNIGYKAAASPGTPSALRCRVSTSLSTTSRGATVQDIINTIKTDRHRGPVTRVL